MKVTITLLGAQRLGEKRGRLPQNLVGPLEFEVFAFELRQALAFAGGQAGTFTRVLFGPAHPPPQRLHRAAQVLGDQSHAGPLRGMLVGVVEDHSDRSVTQL